MAAYSVLVIDDDEVDRETIRRALERSALDCDVREAINAQEGIDLQATGQFDCTLLDQNMPDMTGTDVLRRIEDSETDCGAIVMLTGAGSESVAAEALTHGARDYVTKSDINSDSLQRAVENAVSKDRLERELRQYRDDLERSNQELEQFAYMTSHDLQEPLRIIISFLQLFEKRYKGKFDEKADEYIHYTVDGAQRMQRMITSILELSRIGRHDSDMASFDVDDALDDALENLRMAIVESGVTVNRMPLPKIRGSRNRITQLLQNLIGNAIKYRTNAQPEVTISASPILKGARQLSGFSTSVVRDTVWQFSVADNGLGMKQDYHDRAFLMFQRLDTERSGTGIGLALCKKIVETHHGRIWFESAEGQGTTVNFLLPANGARHDQ